MDRSQFSSVARHAEIGSKVLNELLECFEDAVGHKQEMNGNDRDDVLYGEVHIISPRFLHRC